MADDALLIVGAIVIYIVLVVVIAIIFKARNHWS
jgi:hypothetical protein